MNIVFDTHIYTYSLTQARLRPLAHIYSDINSRNFVSKYCLAYAFIFIEDECK